MAVTLNCKQKNRHFSYILTASVGRDLGYGNQSKNICQLEACNKTIIKLTLQGVTKNILGEKRTVR